MDKFATCKDIAIILAKNIPDSKVCYGLYFPLTHPDTWDERWTKDTHNPFIHFWVEYENRIIDGAKEQFGEPFLCIAPLDDIRYVKVGILDYDEDIVYPQVNDPLIKWPQGKIDPGYTRVRVEWGKFESHRQELAKYQSSL